MNAGKTTSLLQSDHNYRQRGMHTLLYTSRRDQRVGEGVISSRIGLSRKSNVIDDSMNLFQDVSAHAAKGPIHCVFIDEAQFLTRHQVLQATMICDQLAIPVLAYGLRTDFRGQPFEGSTYLLAWADELVEIKTVCKSGRKATMSARVDEQGERVWEGEQVEVGYHYEPLSRHLFNLPRAILKH